MEKKSAMDVFMEQQALAPQESLAEMAREEEFDSFDQEPVLSDNQTDGLLSTAVPGERARKSIPPGYRAKLNRPAPLAAARPVQFSKIKTSEELQLEKESIKVRETGFWFWKRVIVPPNAYVVHTRINRKKPVSMGLGLSFRYAPNKDAYLVIPASIQTIGVVANCISKEKQGINILAYVQWQISNLSIAYRKLDFSDSRDPLGIVNAQLREQAEAAVKDKIATMSVEEVLTDKAPVIEELTSRLKVVTEGRISGKDEADEGLGIKVITVQIREALVSSQSLWRDLQAPFRNEKAQAARISQLEMHREITRKELETRQQTETEAAQTRLEIENLRQRNQTEAHEMQLKEEEVRFQKEQETIQRKLTLEEQTSLTRIESRERLASRENELRLEKELEMIRQEERKAGEEARISLEAVKRKLTLETEEALHKLLEETRLSLTETEKALERLSMEKSLKEEEGAFKKVVQEHSDALNALVLRARLLREQEEHKVHLSIKELDNALDRKCAEEEVKLEQARQEVRNLINSRDLASRLVEILPRVAAELPEIKELRVLQENADPPGTERLTGFLSRILSLFDSFGIKLPGQEDKD